MNSKMAAVKLLQAFAAENPQVRLHNVHPGLLKTAMSAKLAETTKLPFAYDDSKYKRILSFMANLSLYSSN